MSSGMSLINSFFVMLISLTLAFLLNAGLGYALDVMLTRFSVMGIYDVPAAYDPSSNLGFCSNLFHLLIYMIPIFGVGQFIYTAVRRQKYDAYTGYN